MVATKIIQGAMKIYSENYKLKIIKWRGFKELHPYDGMPIDFPSGEVGQE